MELLSSSMCGESGRMKVNKACYQAMNALGENVAKKRDIGFQIFAHFIDRDHAAEVSDAIGRL